MTKSEIVSKMTKNTMVSRNDVLLVVEEFMSVVKETLGKGENVYLREFGSFVIKQRAEKTARDIGRNCIVKVPAHNLPVFIPAKKFKNNVKVKVPVKGK